MHLRVERGQTSNKRPVADSWQRVESRAAYRVGALYLNLYNVELTPWAVATLNINHISSKWSLSDDHNDTELKRRYYYLIIPTH